MLARTREVLTTEPGAEGSAAERAAAHVQASDARSERGGLVNGEESDGWVGNTYPLNVTRRPAGSTTAGFAADGMPIGLQIVAPRHRDDLALQASWAYEQARPWAEEWPQI